MYTHIHISICIHTHVHIRATVQTTRTLNMIFVSALVCMRAYIRAHTSGAYFRANLSHYSCYTVLPSYYHGVVSHQNFMLCMQYQEYTSNT